MIKKRWLTGTIVLCAAARAFTAEPSVRYSSDYDPDRTLVAEHETDGNWMSYKANELSFEAFGTGTVGKRTLEHPSTRRIERNGKLGAGFGMSYFFCRYVGVEGYAYTESTHHNWVDDIGGELVLRLPIANSGVALYGFGGGSRQLDPVYQWTLDAGGGVEWRFWHNIGVFVDGRYVFADETRNYGLGRVGLKFGF
jgi:hypothetical protein